jgi:hypothetical protein
MPTFPENHALPPLRRVANKFVLDAVVAKKFVEVAFVVVEFPTLRSERVEERYEEEANEIFSAHLLPRDTKKSDADQRHNDVPA